MHSKGQRIMAIIGVILLLLLYAVNIFLGITGSPNTFGMLIASAVATIFIPTMIYVYQLMYRVLRRKSTTDNCEDSTNEQ